MTDAIPSKETELAPDPDEDDLDDLDDVLDQFSTNPPSKNHANSQVAPTSSESAPANTAAATATYSKIHPTDAHQTTADITDKTSASTNSNAGAVNDINPDIDEDFVKNLEQGMAELLGSMNAPPDFKQQLEGLLSSFDDGNNSTHENTKGSQGTTQTPNAKPAASSTDDTSQPKPETSTSTFQDKINQTIHRMQDSNTSATAAAATTNAADNSPDAILTQLLHQMEAAGLGSSEGNKSTSKDPSNPSTGPENGEQEAGEDQLDSFLLNMMSELTHKDILYEPMRELHEKYPGWLAQNRDSKSVKAEDWERYGEQRRVVREIVERFERKGYSDESVADREFIVERMQQMQAAGSPPPDLIGDMGGVQEALTDMQSGCSQQ